MQSHATFALVVFVGLMVTAASTANDRAEHVVLSSAAPVSGAATVRIPDPVPLHTTRPEPKIVVDLR